ncbi:MAG: hypothetical protein WCX74_02415 [Candidatus Paceibacterota bacterium]
MKKLDFISIFAFIIVGFSAYYIFGFFFFKGENNAEPVYNTVVNENTDKKAEETKGRSAINLDNCDLRKYDMDCKITKFLEQNLAWANKSEGIDFCAYDYLGGKEGNVYLKAFCEEFYVSDKEMVCPNKEILNKCFVSKDKSECSECSVKDAPKHIVQASGVSVPVRLTESGESFTMWTPRDGSLYDKDLRAEFPADIYPLVSKSKKNLGAITLERAEDYFGAKAVFNVEKTLEDSCNSALDCSDVPGEFTMKSNCPYEMRCIDGKCVVGCYDLIDHFELPIEGK